MSYGASGSQGLVPVNTGNGAAWNQQANPYPIAATATNSMFKGDAVSLSTAGTVIRATASTACLGILDNVTFQSTANPQFFSYPFWPGSNSVTLQTGTVAVAYVIDDPDVMFSVTETSTTGASGTPLTQAAVGNNADLLYTAGNTTTGISAVSLNNATVVTTLLANVKIVGVDPRVVLGVPGVTPTQNGGQQTTGAFTNWFCQFNNHVYKAGSTRP